MSAGPEGPHGGAEQPSEEELRAAWEEQLRALTPADVIVQTAVSLISLAGRRLGVEPGTEDERDLAQVRDAIDGARALLPVLERGEDARTLGPLREALSALQLEYAKLAAPSLRTQEGSPAGASSPAPAPAPSAPAQTPAEGVPEGPGPAQRSGRLWVPGS
jgi:hypothetical protein